MEALKKLFFWFLPINWTMFEYVKKSASEWAVTELRLPLVLSSKSYTLK